MVIYRKFLFFGTGPKYPIFEPKIGAQCHSPKNLSTISRVSTDHSCHLSKILICGTKPKYLDFEPKVGGECHGSKSLTDILSIFCNKLEAHRRYKLIIPAICLKFFGVAIGSNNAFLVPKEVKSVIT